jgi:hypothetical protein
MPTIIWPLLDKLNRTIAFQGRPRSQAVRGVTVIPTMPWDALSQRPGAPNFGRVNTGPTLWDTAPWRLGQAALGLQSERLQAFKTNPRVSKLALQTKVPAVVRPLQIPARIAMISGVTRDSAGAILGGCTVELYLTATDEPLFKVVSDATTGAFTFTCARYAPRTHYIVAYKAGGTDVAGTTLNTLIGV